MPVKLSGKSAKLFILGLLQDKAPFTVSYGTGGDVYIDDKPDPMSFTTQPPRPRLRQADGSE